jgi:hypothetical protein
MPRRRPLRSQLYRAARDLGNIEAIEKGPTAYGRRVVRRKAYSRTNGARSKLLQSILRGLVHGQRNVDVGRQREDSPPVLKNNSPPCREIAEC